MHFSTQIIRKSIPKFSKIGKSTRLPQPIPTVWSRFRRYFPWRSGLAPLRSSRNVPIQEHFVESRRLRLLEPALQGMEAAKRIDQTGTV